MTPECYQKFCDVLNRKTLFFRGYSELSRYCEERDLDYPKIDDNGQLINHSLWYSQVCQSNL